MTRSDSTSATLKPLPSGLQIDWLETTEKYNKLEPYLNGKSSAFSNVYEISKRLSQQSGDAQQLSKRKQYPRPACPSQTP